MSEFLFVYGTLMDPLVQERVFGRVAPREADRLAGYGKNSINLGSGVFPIIKPEVGNSVKGLILRVTPAELELIDQYEGSAYQRKKVTLVSGREAWVYQG